MGSSIPFQQSIAVVIGIDAYSDGVPPLQTPTADAQRLAQLLADDHGYDVRLLLDGQATLAAIENLLADLARDLGPDDRVLFYFAGHGVALEGDDGPTGYLVPQDARLGEAETYLHMPTLNEALNAIACRHLLVILDSCFSGALRWSSTRDMMVLPEVIHQERYDRFILDPAWQALASAAHDQTALDTLPGTFGDRGEVGGHSPFAQALFDALEGAGDLIPKGEGDGVITASELYLYLEHAVQPATIDAGNRQTPRLWPLAKHDKGEFIFLVPGHELNLPPAPPLTYENNPWRGLEAYDEAHAGLFFGRDDVIEKLATHVATHPLTVVLGASGTGKSSVVKAGLVPRLKRDASRAWHVLPIVRTGADPGQAIERAVANLGETGGVEERVARWCAANPDGRLVLVVDQFEELVTLASAAAERDAVLALLRRLVEAHPEQLRVVLTLRSDFEPQFDRSTLEAHWSAARIVVPPMSQAELREVIEKPASERVLYFKPRALVDDLIDEVIQTPGGLPLLSFALSEMYRHYVGRQSDDRAIERADYQAVGGVVGALRTRADAEFDRLDAAHQETMRRLMLRMVAVEGGNVARRRVARSEVAYPDPTETTRAHAVVRQLTAARLVVEGRGEDGEPYVEPAHDALVRAWDRLLAWVHAEQDRVADLRFQHAMSRAAREWEQADPKAQKGLLWRDAARGGLLATLVASEEGPLRASTLTAGQRLRRRTRALRHRLGGGPLPDGDVAVWMNRRELSFAQHSIRRRTTIRVGLSSLVLLVFAGAIAAGVFGFRADASAREARRLQGVAQDSTEAAQRQRILAQLSAQAARDSSEVAQQERANADAQADTARANALEAQRQAQIARDNEAEARRQEQIADANAAEAERERDIALSRFYISQANAALDLDPAEALVFAIGAAEATDSVTTQLQSALFQALQAPRVLREINVHEGEIRSLSFDANGERFLSFGSDGWARVWDAQTGEKVGAYGGPDDRLASAWLSPDGRRLATRSGDDMHIWAVGSNTAPVPLERSPEDRIFAMLLEWSLDSRRVLMYSRYEPEVGVWDATTGDHLVSLQIDGRTVIDATFAVNNRVAVCFIDTSQSIDDMGRHTSVRVWPDNGAEKLFDLGDNVHEMEASPGDDVLLTINDRDRGAFSLWDLSTGNLIRTDTLFSRGVAFPSHLRFSSPDGRLLTGEGPKRLETVTFDIIRGFEIDRRRIPTRIIEGSIDTTYEPPFRFAGERIIRVDYDGRARIWAPAELDPREEVLNTRSGISLAAGSPSGSILTAAQDGSVRLWDIDTGPYRFGAEAQAEAAVAGSGNDAVSPNGRYAFVADEWNDGGVIVEAASGRTVGAISTSRVDTGGFIDIRFSPDSDHILTGDNGGVTRVWRWRTSELIQTYRGHARTVFDPMTLLASRFSPDGTRVVSTMTGIAKVWDVVTGRELAVIGEAATPRVARAGFSPDGRRVVAVGQDGVVRVYTLDVDEMVTIAKARLPLTLKDADRQRILAR